MRAFFLFATLLLLGGCATSSPDIHIQADPGADFSRYRSFAFFSPLGTDKAGYGSILSLHLREATRRALEARGFRYDETRPDLLVNFNARVEDKTDVVSFPSVGYYGYRARWYGIWNGYDVTTIHYQEGTLNIDLIDARQKQLLWEGVAEGRITAEARKNLKATVESAVDNIFSHYPYPARQAAGDK
jgi:hypothetical protein